MPTLPSLVAPQVVVTTTCGGTARDDKVGIIFQCASGLSTWIVIFYRLISRRWYEMHYSDVIMSTMAFQIIGVSIVYLTVCSGADQRKHQSSATLAFVRGIHLWPVNSPHKGPVTRKMFPFDDVIMGMTDILVTNVGIETSSIFNISLRNLCICFEHRTLVFCNIVVRYFELYIVQCRPRER